jgi:hypothetical protein
MVPPSIAYSVPVVDSTRRDKEGSQIGNLAGIGRTAEVDDGQGEYGLTKWGEALCAALDEMLKRAAAREDFMDAPAKER